DGVGCEPRHRLLRLGIRRRARTVKATGAEPRIDQRVSNRKRWMPDKLGQLGILQLANPHHTGLLSRQLEENVSIESLLGRAEWISMVTAILEAGGLVSPSDRLIIEIAGVGAEKPWT